MYCCRTHPYVFQGLRCSVPAGHIDCQQSFDEVLRLVGYAAPVLRWKLELARLDGLEQRLLIAE